MIQTAPYQIHLPQFEGPFDLLLFFIERDELDIQDIPISKITHDFLSYLQTLQNHQIDVASEFILMASNLIRIKTKMLIPRPQIDEKGVEIDPREELMNQLIAYKRFKTAAGQIEAMEIESLKSHYRGNVEIESKMHPNLVRPEDELQNLTLFKIMSTYKKLLEKQKSNFKKPSHVIQRYPYTMEEVKDNILNLVLEKGKIDFLTYVMMKPEKLYTIFSILSILELAQYKRIKIIFGEGFNNFWMTELKDEPIVA